MSYAYWIQRCISLDEAKDYHVETDGVEMDFYTVLKYWC